MRKERAKHSEERGIPAPNPACSPTQFSNEKAAKYSVNHNSLHFPLDSTASPIHFTAGGDQPCQESRRRQKDAASWFLDIWGSRAFVFLTLDISDIKSLHNTLMLEGSTVADLHNKHTTLTAVTGYFHPSQSWGPRVGVHPGMEAQQLPSPSRLPLTPLSSQLYAQSQELLWERERAVMGKRALRMELSSAIFISSSLIKIILISVMVLLRCLEAGEKATSNCYFLENWFRRTVTAWHTRFQSK